MQLALTDNSKIIDLIIFCQLLVNPLLSGLLDPSKPGQVPFLADQLS
jgi:hypothetical protein